MSEQMLPGVHLRAENLAVYYRSHRALAIDTLNLSGNIIAVIGHNGSGKSTMIKTLLELLHPTAGSIEVRSLEHPESVLIPEDHMAYAPENGAVFNDVSVESYIRLWCRIKQGDGNYYKRAGAQLIEELQIATLLGKLGRELSKGQRRRVQTAVGFLTRPRFFLFDEPFDGLDVQQANHLVSVIRSESKTRSMLVSTHRMDIVERLCDMVVVLHHGSLLTTGSVSEVCAALGGESIAVDLPGNFANKFELIANEMQLHFPNALVNSVGSQLLVTGKNSNRGEVHAYLAQRDIVPLALVSTRASLIDAMNYHLQQSSAKEVAIVNE